MRLYSMQHVEINNDVIFTHLLNMQKQIPGQPPEFIVVDASTNGMWLFVKCAALYACKRAVAR